MRYLNCFEPELELLSASRGFHDFWVFHTECCNYFIIRMTIVGYGFDFRIRLHDPIKDMDRGHE